MSMSISQQRALAILPKITGGASFIFSTVIATIILRDGVKRKKFYHRLVLGMSLADISSSIWLAISTWPIPKHSGIIWASGNDKTCTAQGFFTQLGISSPIYNVSLSFYYLLAVRYSWKDSALFNWEIVFHAIPIVWGLGTAIAGIALDILHSANLWCWIGNDPSGDGRDVNIYRMVFFYGPLWFSIGVVTINLGLVFLYVRRITMKSERYTMISLDMAEKAERKNDENKNEPQPDLVFESIADADDDSIYKNQGFDACSSTRALTDSNRDTCGTNKKRSSLPTHGDTTASTGVASGGLSSHTSIVKRQQQRIKQSMMTLVRTRRKVAWQSLRFAIVFYCTWIPISLVRIFQFVEKSPPYALLLLASMMTPMQGLPNFIVYLYPLLLKARKEAPERPLNRWMDLTFQRESPESEKVIENCSKNFSRNGPALQPLERSAPHSDVLVEVDLTNESTAEAYRANWDGSILKV